MLLVTSFLLCLSAFSALAFSMAKHARDIWGSSDSQQLRAVSRVVGWVLLLMSLYPSLAAYGIWEGVVAWSGLTTMAALLVALSLTVRRHV